MLSSDAAATDFGAITAGSALAVGGGAAGACAAIGAPVLPCDAAASDFGALTFGFAFGWIEGEGAGAASAGDSSLLASELLRASSARRLTSVLILLHFLGGVLGLMFKELTERPDVSFVKLSGSAS